mgnify:CR=1 FL=1
MATMNISLTDQMKNWIEESVDTGRYANASDYVRDLIRRDKERDLGIEQLQLMITEGFDSGDSEKTLDDISAEVKQHRTGG